MAKSYLYNTIEHISERRGERKLRALGEILSAMRVESNKMVVYLG